MIKKLAAAALCLLLAGCGNGESREAKKAVPAVMAEEAPVTVRIKAVGDNLIHSPIYKRCATDNGYDFTCLYENIAPYLKKGSNSLEIKVFGSRRNALGPLGGERGPLLCPGDFSYSDPAERRLKPYGLMKPVVLLVR